MFVPDRTRRGSCLSRKEVSKCRATQEMQGQCIRCRWPWGGHGKGRRAAAGVGSSYLVRRDLLAKDSTPSPFAALAGLLVLAGTTATGPLSGRWSTGLDGDPTAKQARKCEQGLGLPPGSQSPAFYPRLYLRRPVRRPFNLSCLRRYRGEEGERKIGCSVHSNCHWKGNRFERSLCYSPLRGRGLLVRQLQ
jgi:hypothetical protein